MFYTAFLLCVLVAVHGADHGHGNHGHHVTTTMSPDAVLAAFKAKVRTQVETLWPVVDADHDGHFDKNDMHHILHDYDTDNDGLVSNAEFVQHFTKNEPGLTVIAKGLFLEFDMNHDGQISDNDLDLYYLKIDTSNDGHVDKAEFETYFTEIFTILFVIQLNTPDGGVGK